MVVKNFFIRPGARFPECSIFHKLIYRKLCERVNSPDRFIPGVIVRKVLCCNAIPLSHHAEFLKELECHGLIVVTSYNHYDIKVNEF